MRARCAFTLIEILVTILVIAVLLGIALPVLARVKSSGLAAVCLSRVSQIVKLQLSFAQGYNKDRWPNDFEPGAGQVDWFFDVNEYGCSSAFAQTTTWPGPLLRNGFLTPLNAGGSLACPAWEKQRVPRPGQTPSWEDATTTSYYYSAAMYTSADLWDVAHPERRLTPDMFRRSVPVADVLFPSQKGVTFEVASFHERERSYIWTPGAITVSVGAADGHARRTSTALMKPALALPWGSLFGGRLTDTDAIPMSSAADGYRGTDW